MTQHAHFTPADKPLADTFAAVLEQPTTHAAIALIGAECSAEDRYELAALLAVTARLHGSHATASTDPLPPS